MKVTTLLGAGAFLEIGGSSTSELTAALRQHRLIFNDKYGKDIDEPFLENIINELNAFWPAEGCNFEDVFDALEKLYSFRLYGSDPKEFKPSLGAFIAPQDSKANYFNREYLQKSIKDVVNIIADKIYQYDNEFAQDNFQWFSSFWQEAVEQCQWDIATLNYDTCIEKSLPIYEDGFDNMGVEHSRYNPQKVRETKLSRILHLHGCILYGYPPKQRSDTEFYENDSQELYKFKNYDQAKESWEKRLFSTTQSHEVSVVGPIITGLSKTDKLITFPYADYNNIFYESLLNSNGILIAGYSFGDKHFNKIIERIVYNYPNKKIIIITFLNASEFIWNKGGSGLLTGLEVFIKKYIKSDQPFINPLISPAESKDGRLRLYFNGFKEAIEHHGQSIIDFLTS